MSLLDGTCILSTIIFEKGVRVKTQAISKTLPQRAEEFVGLAHNRIGFEQILHNLKTDKDRVTRTSFNSAGKIASEEVAFGDAIAETRKIYEYNIFGELTAEKVLKLDVSRNEVVVISCIENEFDRLGRSIVESHSGADGEKTTTEITRDRYGNILSKKDSDGNYEYTYDSLDRVAAEINPLGITTKTSYDAFSRPVVARISDSNGLRQTEAFEYHQGGLTTTTISPSGNRSVAIANVHGETVSVSDALGRETQFKYSNTGKLLEKRLPSGELCRKYYDKRDRLVDSVDTRNTVTHYDYDSCSRNTQIIFDAKVDPKNRNDKEGLAFTEQYVYDSFGLITDTQNSQDQHIQVERTVTGEVALETVDPKGLALTTRYYYAGIRDSDGVQVPVWQSKGGNGNEILHIKLERDFQGRLISQEVAPKFGLQGEALSDSLGYRTSTLYDPKGRVLWCTDANGYKQRYIYDALGQLRFYIDKVGRVLEHRYDSLGREVSMLQYSQLIDVNKLNDPLTVANITALLNEHQDCKEQRSLYDNDGNKIFEISNGAVTAHVYNAAGEVIKTVCFAHKIPTGTELTVDQVFEALAQNRITYPYRQDKETQYIYNNDGRLKYEIKVAQYPFESEDPGLASIGKCNVTEYRYEEHGLVQHKVQYAQSVPVETQYNEQTLKARLQPSSDDRWTTELYDTAGRKIYHVDAAGYIKQYKYDNQYSGKEKEIERIEYSKPYPDTLPRSRESITGYFKDIIDADLVVSTSYDSAGRKLAVKNITYGEELSYKYTYDALGNKLSSTLNGKHITRFEYDLAGQCIATIHPEVDIAVIDIDSQSKRLSSQVTKGNMIEAFHYTRTGQLAQLTKDARLNHPFCQTKPSVIRYKHNAVGDEQSSTYVGVAVDAREDKRLLSSDATNITTDKRLKMDHIEEESLQGILPQELPELSFTKTMDIVDDNTYDGFGRCVIATEASDAIIRFKVYDIHDNVRFEINKDGYLIEKQYNALNQVITEIKYAKPIEDFDAQHLRKHPELLAEQSFARLYIPRISASSDDRHTYYTYSASGSVIIKKYSKVYSYTPLKEAQRLYAALNEDKSVVEKYQPITRYEHNAFGEPILELKLADLATGDWHLKRNIVDKRGRVIQEIEELTSEEDIKDEVVTWRKTGKVIERQYNKDDKESRTVIRYKPVAFNANKDITSVDDVKDRIVEHVYDGLGRLREQRKYGVSYYQLPENKGPISKEELIRKENQVATTRFEYDEFSEVCAEVNPKGQVKLTVRDAMGRVVLATDFERVIFDEKSGSKLGIPVMSRVYDAAGAVAIEIQHATGAEIDKARKLVSITTTKQDRVVLYYNDSRQKALCAQLPTGDLVFYSYNSLGLKVCTWQWVLQYMASPDEKGKPTPFWQFMYQYFGYNDKLEINLSGTLQPNGTIDEKRVASNAFLEPTVTTVTRYNADGTTVEQNKREQNVYNTLGLVIADNKHGGVWQAYLYNPLMHCTATIKSMDASLPIAELAKNPQELLNQSVNILLTESMVNSAGHIQALYEPGYYERKHELNITVCVHNAAYGVNTLSWYKTYDHFVAFSVYLKPQGVENFTEQPLTAKLSDDGRRFGVDISNLENGDYEFRICAHREYNDAQVAGHQFIVKDPLYME